MSRVLLALFLFVLLCAVGCDDIPVDETTNNTNSTVHNTNSTGNATNNTNSTGNTANNTNEELQVEVIESNTVTHNGLTLEYQLLRLTWGAKDPTYAYFALPAQVSALVGVVLSTMPYDVIDWTGEAVDTNQAQYSTPITLQELHENSIPHILHGLGHLAVFGRFYTEGSIQNDVDDMVTGLKYLGQHPRVNTSRIGIFGASWGGFEALYVAAYAPPEAVPAVGAALFPVSDFSHLVMTLSDRVENLENQEKSQEYQDFFAPHLLRIFKTTGGAPNDASSNYTGFTHETMLAHLTTPFLVWHETNDTLVPFEESELLVQEAPNRIDPVFYYNPDPLDLETAPLSHGLLNYFIISLAYVYIYSVLLEPEVPINTMHFPEDFHFFLSYVRDYARGGGDIGFIIPHYLRFMDPRVRLYVDESTPIQSASTVFTEKINELYCPSPALSEEELRTLLEAGSLPTPACE